MSGYDSIGRFEPRIITAGESNVKPIGPFPYFRALTAVGGTVTVTVQTRQRNEITAQTIQQDETLFGPYVDVSVDGSSSGQVHAYPDY